MTQYPFANAVEIPDDWNDITDDLVDSLFPGDQIRAGRRILSLYGLVAPDIGMVAPIPLPDARAS